MKFTILSTKILKKVINCGKLKMKVEKFIG